MFGLAQRETRHALFIVVQDRLNTTLHPIIQKYVDNESTIFHDDWAGYRKLEQYGYMHGAVTHKTEFVSKEGVCTRYILNSIPHFNKSHCDTQYLPTHYTFRIVGKFENANMSAERNSCGFTAGFSG